MNVLIIFLIVFLVTSLVLRVPVAFSIGIGGAVVFVMFNYQMTALAQSAFYGLDNFSFSLS